MARIRSTHPGQWTDEEFVSCSPLARLLAIALRNEADDQGVFEWKPLMLKMRLLPADACDVAELLAELEASNQVRRYEVDGRAYGIIRNFTKFQRPKSPNAAHPLPPDFPSASETLPKDCGETSEKSAQMEDVGGRRKEEEKGEYKFKGAVVRLNAKDYDAWRRVYSAIPDFDAELTRIDAKLREEKTEKWFSACGAMLSHKHQKLLAQGGGRAPPQENQADRLKRLMGIEDAA